jgi:hypothetical protein
MFFGAAHELVCDEGVITTVAGMRANNAFAALAVLFYGSPRRRLRAITSRSARRWRCWFGTRPARVAPPWACRIA